VVIQLTTKVINIKLLFITRGFPPYRGGTENYIWEIYKRLLKNHEIQLITYYHKNRKKDNSIHEITQLKTNNKFLEFLNFFFSSLKMAPFLDYDLIHAVTYPSGLSGILPKFVSGKPLVITIHDIGVIEKEINTSPFTKSLKGFLQGIICNMADAIIVPSEKVRNDIVKYHDVVRSKIFITPYGFDADAFNENVKKGVMRKKWKLKDKQVILYVGMYSAKKGLEYLIEAMNEVKKEISNAVLVIAGPAIDANYEKKIKNLVVEMNLEDNIIFTGYFEEKYKPNVYADADIVVEPTLYGMGYSFACIEANAIGKPVVASKLLEEIGVVKNGVNGIVVPLRDSKSIAEALINLLKDKKLYERLSKNAISLAKKFDWEETAKLTEKVYEKVLGKF